MNLFYDEVVEVCESYDFVLRYEASIDMYNLLGHLRGLFSRYIEKLNKNEFNVSELKNEYNEYLENIINLQKIVNSLLENDFKNELNMNNIQNNKRLVLSTDIRIKLKFKQLADIYEPSYYYATNIYSFINASSLIQQEGIELNTILGNDLFQHINKSIDNIIKFREEIELFKHKRIEKLEKEKTMNYLQNKLIDFTKLREDLTSLRDKIDKDIKVKFDKDGVELINKIVKFNI